MEISIHPTCKALYGEISLQEFTEFKIPKIRFKELVHGDVKKAFVVIERLLVHSYFEFEFLDVAITKSLQTFEMALKLRYEELNGKKWNPKSPLAQLIRYFESRSYLEVLNPGYMIHVRNARNYLSHPERYGFGGFAGLHWVDTTVDLINDLYEDPILRKARLDALRAISKILENLVKEGAVLEGPGIRFVVQAVTVLFINNKSNPNTYTFVISPIFDDPDKNSISPIALHLPHGMFEISETEFSCMSGTKFEYKVHRSLNDRDKDDLAKWTVNKIEDAFLAKQAFNMFRFENVLNEARRKFHFQETAT